MDYLNKKKKTQNLPVPKPPTPNNVEELVAADLKTNIQGVSLVVRKNSNLLQHISLKDVRDWSVKDRSLVIISVDSSDPIVLTFLSNTIAIQAEIRFTNIFNGAILT